MFDIFYHTLLLFCNLLFSFNVQNIFTARSQSRNRSNPRRDSNDDPTPIPMSRQGFIEPPPIDRRSNGLKIISPTPTRQLQSTPTYSKKQELSNGTWKKYFGVFSMVSKIQNAKESDASRIWKAL